MPYGVTHKPSANQMFLDFARDNPEWIALGLLWVNRWGEGIDGVRVQLQQIVAMAVKEAYSRGLEGLPPRDVPYTPPVIRRTRPPQNEPFKPPFVGRSRRPTSPQEPESSPVVVLLRRSPPAPTSPVFVRRTRHHEPPVEVSHHGEYLRRSRP